MRQTDETLMASYQQGDVSSFEVLLQRHKDPLYRFLLRQVRQDRAAAEDLFQEVFLRVVRGAKNFRRQAKFSTWLYTIARNACIDAGRRAKHRKTLSLDAPLGSDTSQSSTKLGDQIAGKERAPEREVGNLQLKKQMAAAVLALSEEQREVFLLRETAGLSFKEIAQIVGCPLNTVKSRMRYALESLRRELVEFHQPKSEQAEARAEGG